MDNTQLILIILIIFTVNFLFQLTHGMSQQPILNKFTELIHHDQKIIRSPSTEDSVYLWKQGIMNKGPIQGILKPRRRYRGIENQQRTM